MRIISINSSGNWSSNLAILSITSLNQLHQQQKGVVKLAQTKGVSMLRKVGVRFAEIFTKLNGLRRNTVIKLKNHFLN